MEHETVSREAWRKARLALLAKEKGRNEQSPHHNLTDWVRLHDRYDEAGTVDATGRYTAHAARDES